MAKGSKINWAKRRTLYAVMDAIGSGNWAALHVYERCLRLESSGLTEKERAYMQRQIIKYRESIEALSNLRERLYKTINDHGRS